MPSDFFLGLLGHEMRLAWRGGFMTRGGGRKGIGPGLIFLIVIGIIATFGGVEIGMALRDFVLDLTPVVVVMADAGIVAAFTLMLSQTLIGAVQSLYERGDLDLLLSSPVAPGKVLAVRLVVMATNAAAVYTALLTPFLIPIAGFGHPEWLAAYGVLVSLALLAASTGISIALGLFSLIGPRRTKTLAQIMAAVLGAAFFLVAQARNILGGSASRSLWTQIYDAASSGRIPMSEPLTWPARALTGQWIPLAVMLGVSFVIFVFTAARLGRRFAADAAAAPGADAQRSARAPSRIRPFVTGPFRAMLRKELRLLSRDPALISQVLLRILYLIPIAFIALRSAGKQEIIAIASGAAGLVFITGQIAGSFAWITISAEDSPEALASSPAPISTLWRAKLTASLIPVAILLAGPIAGMVYFRPIAGVAAAAGCIGAAISTGLIAIWMQKPGKRSEFRRRRGASIVATIVELIVNMLWAGAAALAAVGYAAWAAGPVALALITLLFLRRSEKTILERLQEAV